MKKAVANVTVKIDRVIYQKGTVFTEPFPSGVQREIEAGTGTVSELVSEVIQPAAAAIEMLHRQPVNAESNVEPDDADLDELFGEDVYAEPEPEVERPMDIEMPAEEVMEAPVESNAAKRTRLIREAQERFGVKIDKRKSLAQVEAMILELIANLPDLPDESLPDLSEI